MAFHRICSHSHSLPIQRGVLLDVQRCLCYRIMMKNVERIAIGVASATLLAGCTSVEIPENKTSSNDLQMEQYFNQVQAHWRSVKRGDVGRMANIKLVTLRDED